MIAGKTLDHTQNQAQVSLDVLFSGFLVTLQDPLKQRVLFLIRKQGQLRRIDSADFHFVARHVPYLRKSCCFLDVFAAF